jgi:hypothetical protein
MSDKIRKELEGIRGKIAAAKEQLAAAEDQRVPREQADQQLERLIANKTNDGRLAVRYLADGQAMPYLDGRSTFALLCWLDPDMVRARFLAELDQIYNDGNPGVESSVRIEQQRKLTREIFDLEVAEEQLIVRAEESGLRLTRRGDADPAAILEAIDKVQ